MKAMVLAAGSGTRLRPLTYEIPVPMVPVLDRPVMAHVVDLLQRQGYEEVIANVHHLADVVRGYFGDRVTYRREAQLLGTAGGVRNCADLLGDETFLVMAGDVLTDIDLAAFLQRHREGGGIATLAVKRVDASQGGDLVIRDAEGRAGGFQASPDPAEALSDLANCEIYLFEPAIFDYFPDRPVVDWVSDVFPALLSHDVGIYTHELDHYWQDVGSTAGLRQGSFDALRGRLALDLGGEELDEGLHVGDGSSLEGVAMVEPPVWIGRDVRVGANVRLQGPLVIGDDASVGNGAALKDSIVLPGGAVPAETIVMGAVIAPTDIADSLPAT